MLRNMTLRDEDQIALRGRQFFVFCEPVDKAGWRKTAAITERLTARRWRAAKNALTR
jgi:hypothetical protein